MTKATSPSYQLLERLHGDVDAVLNEGTVSFCRYLGPLDKEVVEELSMKVEEAMIEAQVAKSLVKRTFTILIEALQNSLLHSEKDVSGARLIALDIFTKEDRLVISFMNLTTEEQAAEVERRMTMLNEMDAPTLKSYYLDVMTDGKRSVKGGAGLGLIIMVMKSKNPVDVKLHSDDQDNHVLHTLITQSI